MGFALANIIINDDLGSKKKRIESGGKKELTSGPEGPPTVEEDDSLADAIEIKKTGSVTKVEFIRKSCQLSSP